MCNPSTVTVTPRDVTRYGDVTGTPTRRRYRDRRYRDTHTNYTPPQTLPGHPHQLHTNYPAPSPTQVNWQISGFLTLTNSD